MQPDASSELPKGFNEALAQIIRTIKAFNPQLRIPDIEEQIGREIGFVQDTIKNWSNPERRDIPNEIIQQPNLAETLVWIAKRRAHLDRDWAEVFLHVTRHPNVPLFLDTAYPPQRPSVRSTQFLIRKSINNLPSRNYGKFIPRHDVIERLRVLLSPSARNAIVVLWSLGGMGKTCIADWTARRCLEGKEMPRYRAVVWISDRDERGRNPKHMSFEEILNTIAVTLGYSGYIRFSYAEKKHEVQELLRQLSVLLLIDNAESILDQRLLNWLSEIPEPSMALITTRKFSREYKRAYDVELRGMTRDESRMFIEAQLNLRGLSHLVTDLGDFDELITKAGGNPLAMEWAIARIKHQGKSIYAAIAELTAAEGEVFNNLFIGHWRDLTDAARRLLLAATFFQSNASREGLGAVAELEGSMLDQAIETLVELSLLMERRSSLQTSVRYELHELTREFVIQQLKQVPVFERRARDNWLQWYVELAASVGQCWDDLGRLEFIDPERDEMNAAIKWAEDTNRKDAVYTIARGIRFYYYARGECSWRIEIDLIHARVAEQNGDRFEEAAALAHYAIVVYLMGLDTREITSPASERKVRALQRLEELRPLIKDNRGLLSLYFHASALRALMHREYSQAIEYFEFSRYLRPEEMRVQVEALRWEAKCRAALGNVSATRNCYTKALKIATEHHFERLIIMLHIGLAEVDLTEGHLDAAALQLTHARAYKHGAALLSTQAELYRLQARLHVKSDHLVEAIEPFHQAIELFERMGLRRDAADIQTELGKVWELLNPGGMSE